MNLSEMSAAGSSAGTKGPGRTRLPRNAVWVASLRNALSKYRSWGRDTSLATVLGAEEEVDKLLNELWERYACDGDDTPSPFAKKVAELKSFFEQKLEEITAKEAEYSGQAPEASGGETPAHDDPEVIKKAIKRTLEISARRKFRRLRLQVKNEVLKTIRTLRDTYAAADTKGAKRSLPSDATKAMNTWFQSHSSDPYPSDAEKEAFAAQYGITVDQVTTWFTNKRYRKRQKD